MIRRDLFKACLGKRNDPQKLPVPQGIIAGIGATVQKATPAPLR